jgi:hypothetical protein
MRIFNAGGLFAGCWTNTKLSVSAVTTFPMVQW